MEEDAKIAAQKSGRLSFYVVNAIADGCTTKTQGRFTSNASTFWIKRKCVFPHAKRDKNTAQKNRRTYIQRHPI